MIGRMKAGHHRPQPPVCTRVNLSRTRKSNSKNPLNSPRTLCTYLRGPGTLERIKEYDILKIRKNDLAKLYLKNQLQQASTVAECTILFLYIYKKKKFLSSFVYFKEQF